MTGLLSNKIKRAGKTLEERGLPADSFFEVEFTDGSVASEKHVSWSAFCEERRVRYFDATKTVFVCALPARRIRMRHGSLIANMDVPQGSEVYQSVRSETVLMSGKRVDTVIGRVIGIIDEDEVVEEQFLNGIEGCVHGTKK